MQIYLQDDTSGKFLRAVKSTYAVRSVLDANQPLFRQEYDDVPRAAPAAHWHLHGERGSLSQLLTLAQQHRPREIDTPHMMQSLHFPVGGSRFRPCVEDFLEFLVVECGVDRKETWREAIDRGREDWRRRQLRTVVRDLQQDAADLLVREGWTVSPPDGWQRAEGATLLRRW